jgi:hypothetical protein
MVEEGAYSMAIPRETLSIVEGALGYDYTQQG